MHGLFTRATHPKLPNHSMLYGIEGMTLRSLLGTSQPVKGTD